MSSKLLEVAVIGRTIGLKGAIKLHNKSDFFEQFKKGAKFVLKGGESLEIIHFSPENSTAIFKGYEDINLAKELVNKTIYQTLEKTRETCKLKKDEFFYFDIIGLNVLEKTDEASLIQLGIVEDILEIGASYLLLIKTDAELVKNEYAKEFYIPYVDNFIKEVSLKDKTILVKNSLEILLNS